MKILTFAGSLRKESFNKRLSHFSQNFIKSNNLADITFCDLQPLQIPMYDADIETSAGLPDGVQQLVAQIADCQALILAVPEYNGSITGVLKNTLDWVSRHKPNVLAGKHVLMLAASPGALGGVRSLWHSRVPLEVLGCHVYPEMLGVSKAHEVLSPEGQILDEKIKANLERLLKEYVTFIGK
jgi:chromate reductase, NAD(P)H dehydrogenase (quinone)